VDGIGSHIFQSISIQGVHTEPSANLTLSIPNGLLAQNSCVILHVQIFDISMFVQEVDSPILKS
jgi:hypothetical protein